MRVLVTGSRQLLDQGVVYTALDTEYRRYLESGALEMGEPFQVVHGGAPGADTLANQWCFDRRNEPGIAPVEVHPADWRRGSYAGHQRNFEMVQLGADVVLGFLQPGAGNRGTRNCLELARRFLEFKGTRVEEMWADG